MLVLAVPFFSYLLSLPIGVLAMPFFPHLLKWVLAFSAFSLFIFFLLSVSTLPNLLSPAIHMFVDSHWFIYGNYGWWYTGALCQMYCKINELCSFRDSPHQSGSQSFSELKDANRKSAETGENKIQSEVVIKSIKGLKQHHSRMPPVLNMSMPKPLQAVEDALHGHT